MIDFGKFVVFKPVSGGYVYRAPIGGCSASKSTFW